MTDRHIIAVVGLAGSGKSEVAKFFEKNGYYRIRFGDITEEELRKKGLPVNEENERIVREELRKKYAEEAYAILNLPKIENALKNSNVVIDGLYSWKEYTYLLEKYRDRIFVVAVYASPKTRYKRLTTRKLRPLSENEAHSRDFAEIENINKAGPIVMADFTIINEGSLEELFTQCNQCLHKISQQ